MRWNSVQSTGYLGIYYMLGTTLEIATLVIEKKISWPVLWNSREELFLLVM